jgi:hypothetical protein
MTPRLFSNRIRLAFIAGTILEYFVEPHQFVQQEQTSFFIWDGDDDLIVMVHQVYLVAGRVAKVKIIGGLADQVGSLPNDLYGSRVG